jgi:carboxyl-terminal processing protease
LTVARYYTPSGRCIQKPYKGKSEAAYESENETRKGELLYKDSIKVADTTNYRTTSGKKVYGGGGITPDIFVPIDAAYLNEKFNVLRTHIAGFAGQYVQQKKANLPTDSQAFLQNFKLDEPTMKAFWSYAASRGTVLDKKQQVTLDKETRNLLKARIGRIHFGSNDIYYKAILQNDPMIMRAKEVTGK